MALADMKKKIKETKEAILNPTPEWSLEDAKELIETIRTTVLNYGYLIGLGGDVLSSKPTNTLQLIFTPGTPVQLAETIAPTMQKMFIYVNAPNEDRLMKWFDKVWGSGSKSIAADDPVITFGKKEQMNNGGIFPVYIGYDKNMNHVYLNKVGDKRTVGLNYPQFQLGKRIIQVNILPIADKKAFLPNEEEY